MLWNMTGSMRRATRTRQTDALASFKPRMSLLACCNKPECASHSLTVCKTIRPLHALYTLPEYQSMYSGSARLDRFSNS